MGSKPQRNIFYTATVGASTLIAWLLSQLFLDVLQAISRFSIISPYMIVLIIVTPFIASSVVVAELFLSSPTRLKANWRILSRNLLKTVFLLGLTAGLILSLLNWLLIESQWLSIVIRIISWSLIGAFSGLAESLSWSSRSMEGSGSRVRNRIIYSTTIGLCAGFVSACFFEATRRALGVYDEPFGFLLLGLILGFSLCFSTHPTYQAALRAGQGFEAIQPLSRTRQNRYLDPDQNDENEQNIRTQPRRPCLKNYQLLKFIPDDDGTYKYIEEGLSIQLPIRTNRALKIGSSDDADIYIPYIPEECASLKIQGDVVELQCLYEGSIQIQRKWLLERRKVILRHNQIVTLYYENNPEKFYRFVFYNRFLDPQG